MEKKRVMSAMRPTGLLHLGHYFGALDNWIKMQNEFDCFFGIADWHALTTNYENPENIKENSRQLLIDWLSVGIDADKTILFIQSHIKQHAELNLLLGMVTPVTWLERSPSYKELREQLTTKDLNNYGFLGYPVLQTADIIIYDANLVPVGVDQVPHVELSREIVRRFNFLYQKEVFVEPKAKLTDIPKLPGLDGRKMSKSYNNSITLSDSEEIVDKKIKTMITDPNRIKRSDPGNPNICPVFEYHNFFSTDEEKNHIVSGCTNATIGCIECKKILISHIQIFLTPIRQKRSIYEKEIKDPLDFLKDHHKKASFIAEKTLHRAREALKI